MSQLDGPVSYSAYSILGFSVASFVGLLTFNRCRRTRHYADKTHVELEEQKRKTEVQETEILSLRRLIEDIKNEAMSEEDRLRHELSRAQDRSLELQRQLDRYSDQNQVLIDRLNRQGKERSAIEDELRQIKAKHTQTLKLLDTRTSELKGAQTYLTTADALSGADIIKMMEALNTEILQTAAVMADWFEFGEKLDMSDKEEEEVDIKEASDRASDILGDRMVDLLRSTDHRDDPMLIQTAFQACICACTQWVISSWYFDNPENDQLLSDIYAKVRDGEEQAVAGRWRALTRSYAKKLLPSESNWQLYVVDGLVSILIAAGYKESNSSLQETITAKFGDKISIVANLASRLSKGMGEEVISCDTEALHFAAQDRFDPSTMEDALARQTTEGAGGSMVGRILCTTDLGLQRTHKVSATKEWRWTIPLKAKIVFEHSLSDVKGDDDSEDS